ncbi:MAG: glucosidase, partial [Gluconacetobacter diazotrophicus]|nr:glucosidase [Gluconacetobacter diazotrophicus]
LRLHPAADAAADPFADFDAVFDARLSEADAFYAALQAPIPDADTRLVQRQAFAGMLWSKQFYEYDVKRWLDGDPAEPPPPASRRKGRNGDWIDFDISAIISMPDKWEYPWFASWDLALQTAVLALVDPDFAKEQVLLLLREGRMHPNAALPAYEWSFGDANPPLHAWAAWRVFECDRTFTGAGDHDFLKRVFNKLTMNFTWWVNRKDASGKNIFQGGFLGLDNIAIFDRSAGELPTGGTLSQSDGTAWMAMYALAMLRIAVELARHDASYQDIAAKFAEHFLVIAGAEGNALWDDDDGFFYDRLTLPSGEQVPLRTRTMVGLIPLYAVAAFDLAEIDALHEFKARMDSFLARRPDLARLVATPDKAGTTGNGLMALLRTHRLGRILERVLDEKEFLSPHGLRAVSRCHEAEPYRFEWQNKTFELPYWPAEGRSRLFGGNSNWRGPVWMPVNYLLLESLVRFDRYYDGGYRVSFPTGSDRKLTLREVAGELASRLVDLYRRGTDGTRAVHGDHALLQQDPHFRDLLLFYEYYHGDTGRGVGASHQCGWSGLVALLIHNLHWNGPQALPRPAAPA